MNTIEIVEQIKQEDYEHEHFWEDITTTSDEYTVEICIYCGEKSITKPIPF